MVKTGISIIRQIRATRGNVLVLIILVYFTCIFDCNSQSRKYISQFSHFQSYFNPGLTGYEGTTFRGLVRNQWNGLEGAPRTVFAGMEVDFADFSKLDDPKLAGKNAMGLNLLSDRYGAFMETELVVSYASRVRITENHNLRLGAGLVYNTVRLDGDRIFGEQANDPIIQQYTGSFGELEVLDFNLGLALTHDNYYLSYGMQYVNKGRLSRGDQFMDERPQVSILQAGVRENINENIGLIFNFFYRNQMGLPDNIEGNLKGLFMKKLWLGTGYRLNYTHNYQIGVVMPRFRIGYIYEVPVNKNLMFLGQTHEFILMFNVFEKKGKEESLPMW